MEIRTSKIILDCDSVMNESSIFYLPAGERPLGILEIVNMKGEKLKFIYRIFTGKLQILSDEKQIIITKYY